MHIHYTCTVELEHVEGVGHFGEFFGRQPQATNTLATFSAGVAADNAGFTNDNAIHRDYGVSISNDILT